MADHATERDNDFTEDKGLNRQQPNCQIIWNKRSPTQQMIQAMMIMMSHPPDDEQRGLIYVPHSKVTLSGAFQGPSCRHPLHR
eukprot:9352449-Ditylum_brightwellii.AAC.1